MTVAFHAIMQGYSNSMQQCNVNWMK